MNVDYFDQMIPKRWILLLSYWLPFLKTPSSFYFECRAFIDELMPLDNDFFWKKFPDLVSIFEHAAENKTERILILEILYKIFSKEKKITLQGLALLFEKFKPEVTSKTSILSVILKWIPDNIYFDYFSRLKEVSCSLEDLKWCVYLKDKFKLEDRLTLILSLNDDEIIKYQSTLFKLLMQECEESINPQRVSNSLFNAHVNEQLLEFMLSRELKLTHKRLIFSNFFIQTFINQRLEKKDPQLASYLLKLDIPKKFNFFENFLVNSENFQQTSRHFLKLFKENQWPELVDHLINAVSSAQVGENEDRQEEVADNWNSFLLTQLQKADYTLNLFQFLAVHALMKKKLDLEQLKKIFNASNLIQYAKHFPPACQLLVTEYSILEIKKYIKDNIMIHVRKENTRQDIHRPFNQFYNNEYVDKTFNVTELILNKLPEDLQPSYQTDLNFLQEFLSQLYLIADDRSVVDYKNKHLEALRKDRKESEARSEARRELIQRIQEGKQSSVSHQRMQEIFGSESPKVQEKWKQVLGIHFFDANNKEEYSAAIKEAQEIIKFHREYDEFPYLSSSSSCSYYST